MKIYKGPRRELDAFYLANLLLVFKLLPQYRELKNSLMTMDTVKKALIDDLKLFADAMHKRMGENYFLLWKQCMIPANTFRRADWRKRAKQILEQEEPADEYLNA
jgi:hypothetical protein